MGHLEMYPLRLVRMVWPLRLLVLGHLQGSLRLLRLLVLMYLLRLLRPLRLLKLVHLLRLLHLPPLLCLLRLPCLLHLHRLLCLLQPLHLLRPESSSKRRMRLCHQQLTGDASCRQMQQLKCLPAS